MKKVSVAMVRCLHQCRHFYAEQLKISRTMFMNFFGVTAGFVTPLLIFSVIYNEEAIVTGRNTIIIFNASHYVCLHLINPFAQLYHTLGKEVFGAKYGIHYRNKHPIPF
jgi:hypothetical protein